MKNLINRGGAENAEGSPMDFKTKKILAVLRELRVFAVKEVLL
jgi:hypothetical protein